MQLAIKITNNSDIEKLNDYLIKGWKVINSCPMPSSTANTSYGTTINATCLVIIEKVDQYGN